MHYEVEDFLHHNSIRFSWRDARVVEIGSLNVNGRSKDHVPGGWSEWIGIDVISGPDVDVVGHAADVLPELGEFDVVVTTEALEHDARWTETLAAIQKCVKPGGHVMLTCAGTGRPPHAADGSGPPHAGEHYENRSLSDVYAVLQDEFELVFGEEGPPGDTRAVLRKTTRED